MEKIKRSLGLLFIGLILATVPGTAQQQVWKNPNVGGDKVASAALFRKARQAFQNEDYVTCINLLRNAIHIDQGKELYHLCAMAMVQSETITMPNLMFVSLLPATTTTHSAATTMECFCKK